MRHLPGPLLRADEGPGTGGLAPPDPDPHPLRHLRHQQGLRRGVHPDPCLVCYLHRLRHGEGGEGDRRFCGLHRVLYLPGGLRRHDQQRLRRFKRSENFQHPGCGDHGHGRGGRYCHRPSGGKAPRQVSQDHLPRGHLLLWRQAVCGPGGHAGLHGGGPGGTLRLDPSVPGH